MPLLHPITMIKQQARGTTHDKNKVRIGKSGPV